MDYPVWYVAYLTAPMLIPLIAVHALALISNALARQVVQTRSLERWAQLDKLPVRGDWDSFFLFIGVLLVVLICLGWLARVTFRAAHSQVKSENAER